MIRALLGAALLLSMWFSSAQPAVAISTQSSTPVTVNYVAAFEPMFRGAFPYTGTMELTFRNGIVSGRYRDMSIRPGAPFANQITVPISGGVSGQNIHFSVGQGFRFNGTIAQDGSIDGTATYSGRMYNFIARVGKPGSGG